MDEKRNLVSHAATVFAVDNVKCSTEYYRDKLGFTITFEMGDPPTYAVTNRDSAVYIHFSKKEDDTQPAARHTAVYVFVHDVDEIYEEFLRKGVEITNPIGDREYGMRDFDITDINGHIISFAKHL